MQPNKVHQVPQIDHTKVFETNAKRPVIAGEFQKTKVHTYTHVKSGVVQKDSKPVE